MRNKFHATKVKYGGRVFDSAAERDRYIELKAMEDRGEITSLQCQPSFEIIPKLTKEVCINKPRGVKIVQRVDEMAAVYTPDFLYYKDGVCYVEEYKSKMTAKLADYILRRKLLKKQFKEINEKVGRLTYVFIEVVK